MTLPLQFSSAQGGICTLSEKHESGPLSKEQLQNFRAILNDGGGGGRGIHW